MSVRRESMIKPKSALTDKNTIYRYLLKDNKLTWDDTFKAISEEKENWDDLNVALMDGLEDEYPSSQEM
jgi:hypothetical protein